jgi:hypothetical protein
MFSAPQFRLFSLFAAGYVAFVASISTPTSLAHTGADGGVPRRPSLVEAASEADEDVQFAITHSLKCTDPLPVGASDAIVVGRVLAASCHLAPDGASVSTHFTVRVEEALKDAAGPFGIANHSLIDVEGVGGTVQLPSGRAIAFAAEDTVLPEVGMRYAFFLSYGRFGARARILNLYPLNETETAFLNELRDAIIRSR